MIGLAASPGTEVEPACSRRRARLAERTADPVGFPFVEPGPGGVVLDDRDRPVGPARLADRHLLELPLAFGAHSGQSSRVYRSSNEDQSR